MKILVIIFIAAFTSCEPFPNKQPIVTEKHGDYDVQLLFEKDGCKVYKFYDDGRAIYWSNCEGRINYTYRTQTGKMVSTHDVEASTTVQVSDTTQDAQNY